MALGRWLISSRCVHSFGLEFREPVWHQSVTLQFNRCVETKQEPRAKAKEAWFSFLQEGSGRLAPSKIRMICCFSLWIWSEFVNTLYTNLLIRIMEKERYLNLHIIHIQSVEIWSWSIFGASSFQRRFVILVISAFISRAFFVFAGPKDDPFTSLICIPLLHSTLMPITHHFFAKKLLYIYRLALPFSLVCKFWNCKAVYWPIFGIGSSVDWAHYDNCTDNNWLNEQLDGKREGSAVWLEGKSPSDSAKFLFSSTKNR